MKIFKTIATVLLLSFANQYSASAQSSFLKGFLQGMAEGYNKSNSSSSTTTQSRSSVYNSTPQKNSSTSKVSGKKRREELGGGGFVIVEEYPTFQFRTRWGLCPNCRGAKSCSMCYGTRQCTFCKGRGVIISEATGNILSVCTACNQTGLCSVCKGRGACICNEGDYPGYAIYETKQIDNEGNVMFDDKANYNDRKESSKSSSRSSASRSSSSSRGTCSKCHGIGYDTDDMKYAPASASGWMPPHHNSSGSKCSICGKTYDHYHTPCSGCRGFRHN